MTMTEFYKSHTHQALTITATPHAVRVMFNSCMPYFWCGWDY